MLNNSNRTFDSYIKVFKVIVIIVSIRGTISNQLSTYNIHKYTHKMRGYLRYIFFRC